MPTIEALDMRFEQALSAYDMKFFATNESVLNAPSAIASFFKRCILLLDDYVNGITEIMHEKARQKEILHYVHALESIRNTLIRIRSGISTVLVWKQKIRTIYLRCFLV